MSTAHDRPCVVYATIYPPKPDGRSETFVTRELVREYLSKPREWRLEVVIASAHAASLDAARTVMAEFPEIPAEFWHMETKYAGTRAEEISYCKEQLPLRLAQKPGWDWMLFMDADVWTRIGQVDSWMRRIGDERETRLIKIKYTLRDRLQSPAHTLGAYLHHRELLERMEYWKIIFPRDASGRRTNAPDCLLHDYLEGNGCKKIVPEPIATLHFLNGRDAQWYCDGRSLAWPGARDVQGSLAPAAWAGEPPPDGQAETAAPLVSALMITGKAQERVAMANVAIASFTAQTYPARELVVVNHGGAPLRSADPRVREIVVPKECSLRLGDLRNLGLAACSGEWVLLWDDDDWHGPERIAAQMKHAQRDTAVLLQNQIRYSLLTRTGYVYRDCGGIHGTYLHHRDVAWKYPRTARGEDTEFLKQFPKRIALENDPGLFVRFAHSTNTWDERHIMREYAGREDVLDMPPNLVALLREKVLPICQVAALDIGGGAQARSAE